MVSSLRRDKRFEVTPGQVVEDIRWVLEPGAVVEGVVQIRLVEGGAVVGRVLGLEPDRLASVQVVARGGGGSPVDHEGGYRIEHLPSREWKVAATERGSGLTARGRVMLELGVRMRSSISSSPPG